MPIVEDSFYIREKLQSVQYDVEKLGGSMVASALSH